MDMYMYMQICVYIDIYVNMYAANPTFARIGSRISLDMLKSICRVSVVLLCKA